jgi:hypothetical protein
LAAVQAEKPKAKEDPAAAAAATNGKAAGAKAHAAPEDGVRCQKG